MVGSWNVKKFNMKFKTVFSKKPKDTHDSEGFWLFSLSVQLLFKGSLACWKVPVRKTGNYLVLHLDTERLSHLSNKPVEYGKHCLEKEMLIIWKSRRYVIDIKYNSLYVKPKLNAVNLAMRLSANFFFWKMSLHLGGE